MGKAGDVRATRICTLPGRHQEFHPGTYIYTSLARMLPFCQPSVQGGLGITGATATLTKAELLRKKGVQLYFYKTLKRKKKKREDVLGKESVPSARKSKNPFLF